eukprot:m.299116 g.299116  ORF g.299116 m.299116 type:complete len:227 (-) comp55180_c0_seq6:573-1253(-)
MTFYARVGNEFNASVVELPLEENLTLSAAVLTAQFPRASGLKYVNTESGAFRAIRLVAEHYLIPTDDLSRTFIAIQATAPATASEAQSGHASVRTEHAPADTSSIDRDKLRGDDDRSATSRDSCRRCGGQGHYSMNCPMAPGNGPCYACGGVGHTKATCPSVLQKMKCFQCGGVGHRAVECPLGGAPGGGQRLLFIAVVALVPFVACRSYSNGWHLSFQSLLLSRT